MEPSQTQAVTYLQIHSRLKLEAQRPRRRRRNGSVVQAVTVMNANGVSCRDRTNIAVVLALYEAFLVTNGILERTK